MAAFKRILTTLFLIQFFIGLACDCSPLENHDELIESSFNHYDHIFVGEVIEVNNQLWIEVVEVFKGDLKPEQLLSIASEEHSCSYHFRQKGLGLFYGSVANNKFSTDLCSPTRMFDAPYLYPPPPPPFPGSEPEPESDKQRMVEYEEVEKQRLEYEIEQLRKRKN